jgi:mitotic-spindle organizing protein 1
METRELSLEQREERKNEILEISYEIARLLETGLDRETLQVAIELLEQGFDPYALASVIKELRRQN